MTLRTERIRTFDQIRAFLDGSEPTDFRFAGRDSAYDFVRRTLVRFEFHGLDNGSEYINREVADLLNRLHIPTFTKSRPRRSNDNAVCRRQGG